MATTVMLVMLKRSDPKVNIEILIVGFQIPSHTVEDTSAPENSNKSGLPASVERVLTYL
jgi:hypothetical protein